MAKSVNITSLSQREISGSDSFPRRLFRTLKSYKIAAFTAIFVAGGSYYYQTSQSDQFLSEARILLLAPQEQYLPGIGDELLSQQSSDNGISLADALIEELKSEPVLNRVIDELDLARDEQFASIGFVRALFLMARTGSLSLGKKEIAFDRVQNALNIKRLEPRRVISIEMKAPQADTAARIANSLAQTYLSLLSQKRQRAFQNTVDRLGQQINSVSSQMKQESGALSAEQSMSSSVPETGPLNLDRGALIKAEVSGRRKMLERLRLREAEMKKFASMDLLPPAARILVRATAPYTPVEKQSLLLSALAGVFTLLLGAFLKAVGARTGRKEKLGNFDFAISEILPEEVRLSYPKSDLPALPSADVGQNAVALAPEFSSHETGGEGQNEIFDMIGEQLADRTHARIVLMAQDHSWGEKGISLAKSLQMQRSVAHIHLATPLCSDVGSPTSAQSNIGIADFLDGKGSFSDFIDEEWTDQMKLICAGSRPLDHNDLLSSQFHALLIALEAAYDMVLIDLGKVCENVTILKALASVPDALAFVLVPDITEAEVTQLHEAVGFLGFADSLIVADSDQTGDCVDRENEELLRAAE